MGLSPLDVIHGRLDRLRKNGAALDRVIKYLPMVLRQNSLPVKRPLVIELTIWLD
jgi:hypothetical protein